MVGEAARQHLAVVVIARHQHAGQLELRQQAAQAGVFGLEPLVYKVAGDQHQVGARIEPVQVLDRIGEHAVGIDGVLVALSDGPDMQVGDLRPKHRFRTGGR